MAHDTNPHTNFNSQMAFENAALKAQVAKLEAKLAECENARNIAQRAVYDAKVREGRFYARLLETMRNKLANPKDCQGSREKAAFERGVHSSMSIAHIVYHAEKQHVCKGEQ